MKLPNYLPYRAAAVGAALLVSGPDFSRAQTTPPLPEPPGTVRLADNLFVDEAEVANLHWLEYLHFIRRDSSAQFFRSQLPDTTKWVSTSVDTGQAVQPFFWIPTNRTNPITNITHEQARAYCRWRSAVVSRGYFQSAAFRKQHPELRDYTVTVEYRLPTEAEWEQAAAGGLPPGPRPFELVQTRPTRKSKPLPLTAADDLVACLDAQHLPHPAAETAYELPFNLKENYYLAGSNQVFFCAPARETFPLHAATSGPPNGLGVLHVIGNVAEMTATPGLAKGGSFKTSVQGLTLRSRQPYQGPQNWLGFRCVATVRLVRK
ncbi:formylglycine-generating enzyme family protein [Hymenobacter weizhouensis]|uniref:formylglycine-generating enzyme family protein n=1 Tax=Hymenobacter sp. YIM 151500-1 TaxID=2987689 RepID=UPI0022278E95|nr:formylglycine-generating enzyme family protein [Hymenobacter sp. YIM 151500-1]UYZ64723.1 formylglycine-generating enzyme family protein [Hymenobacter sp. YIM 151500-1]